MVSSTIAGAEYGLTLIWALAAGVVLKFAITEGAARWQLGTGNTLMEGWRDHLPARCRLRLLPLLHRLELLRLERAGGGERAGAGSNHPVGAVAGVGIHPRRRGVHDGVVRPLRALSLGDQVVRRPEVWRRDRLGAADRVVVRVPTGRTSARSPRSRRRTHSR
jgi:hypothetical protein